jgi:hypothetical protein
MGIVKTSETPKVMSPAARRKSGALDFGSLKPLNAAAGTKNFGGYRETSPKSKKKTADAMDSDADDEDEIKAEEMDDDKDIVDKGLLSPEDALKQGELAEGVRKIKVCQPWPTQTCLANSQTAQTSALCRAARSPNRPFRDRLFCVSSLRYTGARSNVTR